MAAAEKPAKPKTRVEIEAHIAELAQNLTNAQDAAAADRRLLKDAREREKETRAQFDDLKARLVNSELENARMRGYIARLQEDDVVREPLVQVGDVDGEQRLVPKRKPTVFREPPVVSDLGDSDRVMTGIDRGWEHREIRPGRRQHWVTY